MNKYLFNFSKHLIIILLFTTISCHEKKKEKEITKTIEPNLLLEDVNFLIESLEKRHVDFYQRANKDSIKLIKEKISSKITKSMNRVEFFKTIAQFNPYFNDAHCLVFPLTEEADGKKEQGFPFQSDSVLLRCADCFCSPRPRFPVQLLQQRGVELPDCGKNFQEH